MNDLLHIRNARIWTGELAARRPWARAITIEAGRVTALDEPPPARAQVLDADGAFIVPGLIDAHMHLLRGGRALTELDLSGARSRPQFEELIAQRHAMLAPDQWLIGRGWSQENWRGGEESGRMPDKTWLRVAAGRPCVCYRMDMHMAVVNDAVLRLCRLDRDPVGGRIERDGAGEPTGLMVEAAAWQLVNQIIPELDATARRRALLEAQHHAHALGITAVGSMEYARDVEEVLAPARAAGELSLRCRATLLDRPLGSEPIDCSFGRAFPADERLAIIGYKTFIDGTLGSRTARMLEDYADDPGNRGLLVEVAAAGAGPLGAWARAVAANGFSPSMHAIGDEAVRLALDAIDGLDPRSRPRIEHAQHIDLADLPRFGVRGVRGVRGVWGRIASMQPLHKADDCRYARARLGERRMAGAFAFRRLLDVGGILAFGSDWPVVSCDPMLGIRAAVTGLTFDGEVVGADQNLTADEALLAYTRDAAFALGMNDAGTLRPGAVGDLVMLDRDPLTCDWVHASPKVMRTVVGGRVVYDASRCEDASVVGR